MAKNSEATLLIKIKEQGAEALGKLGDGLDYLAGKAKWAAAALVAYAAVAVKAFGESESASNSLRQAIKNQGLDVEKLSARYESLAKAIQNKTSYDDDDIKGAIAVGQAYAGQIELTDDLIEATIDFAAATGTDLKSAFEKVGKSIGTTNNALKREGIELDEAASQSEKLEAITGSLIARFDGMAAAQTRALGPIQKLKHAFSDFTESLGEALLPAVNKVATGLTGLIDKASQVLFKKTIKDQNEVLDELLGTQKKAEEKAIEEGLVRKKKAIDKAKSMELAAHREKLQEQEEKENEKIERDLERVQGWLDQFNEAEAKAAEKRIEEERKAGEKAAEERKKVVEDYNNNISFVLQNGFQGIAQKGIETLTNSFLPGFGGAAGQAFQILSQNTDAFAAHLDKVFSVEFVENIAKNIDHLAEKMPEIVDRLSERMPDVVAALIVSLVENAPKIAMAISQAISDPNLYKEMGLSFRHQFYHGIKNGWDEVWDYLKDRMKIKIEMPGGGGGGGGGGVLGGISEQVSSWFARGGVVKPIYAAGGMMIPRGTDTVPAMLTPGEFVVNRNAAQANMGLLQSINSGGGGGGGTTINLVVNGGLLGDAQSAQALAQALDREFLKLRQQNRSVSFDKGVF